MLDDYLLHIPLAADPGISGQTPCVLGGQGYSTCSASQYLPNAHSVNKALGRQSHGQRPVAGPFGYVGTVTAILMGGPTPAVRRTKQAICARSHTAAAFP
jgi:hypothetical protein